MRRTLASKVLQEGSTIVVAHCGEHVALVVDNHKTGLITEEIYGPVRCDFERAHTLRMRHAFFRPVFNQPLNTVMTFHNSVISTYSTVTKMYNLPRQT